MPGTLVDTNILFDLQTEDADWFDWSAAMLARAREAGALYINPIIYAEASVRFETIEELDDAFPRHYFRRAEVPWAAGFLAGQAYLRYRRNGGTRRSPLAEFYIGAHAAIAGFTLLTRDAKRYRASFPSVRIVAP
jgi:predicted nucleic acid-binding protein